MAFRRDDIATSSRKVVYSAEFRRIEALPRRPWHWSEDPILDEARVLLKQTYGQPGNAFELRDVQVAAIMEAWQQRGGFFPVVAGGGKTWIVFFIPLVIRDERPLMLVTADLRDKAHAEDIPQMRALWTMPPRLKIMSYDELSREGGVNFLFDYKPTSIICDEVQALANPRSGRTRRVERYMDAYPETMFFGASGTITDKSLMDFAHIARWCLKGNCPLPSKPMELQEWANALDDEVDEAARVNPGALIRFCENGESPRSGFQRRLAETPGVIATGDDRLPNEIVIRRIDIPVPARVQELLEKVRYDWSDPNGDPIMEKTKQLALLRQMALGFWLRWDPPAPMDWLEARKAWAAYVRRRISNNSSGIDTELFVINEQRRLEEHGRPTHPTWAPWQAIKDSFVINTVPEWVDDFAVHFAAQWLRDHHSGIAWVRNPAFGERLAMIAGVRYFGAGEDASRDIRTCQGPIVASINSHHRGKNLQDRYDHNLLMSVPTNGKIMEQLMARTHRSGQQSAQVFFDLAQFTPELENAFEKACSRARYIEEILGSTQRLNYATLSWPVKWR